MTPAEASEDFSLAGIWARDAILAVSRQGLMAGIGHDRFAPRQIMSRAQMAQITMNLDRFMTD